MKNLANSFLQLLFILLFSVTAFATNGDWHVISDTEGGLYKIDALVKEHKLKIVNTPQGPRLEFTNSTDGLIFNGDLSGPNWHDQEHPHDILLRDMLLDLKQREPGRLDFVMGNHEENRWGWIRQNIVMEDAVRNHKDIPYTEWLKKEGKTDSTLNRVWFWGNKAYGLERSDDPRPLRTYIRELRNNYIDEVKRTTGRVVTAEEAAQHITPEVAAQRWADDYKVGKTPAEDGKSLKLLLLGQPTTIRNGYLFTHAPPTEGSISHIPSNEGHSEVEDTGVWSEERNHQYSIDRDAFMRDARAGQVPSPKLERLGDASWDEAGKGLTNDSMSLTYTERPTIGDRYGSISQKAADKIAKAKTYIAGVVSGHKPCGNFITAHQMNVLGRLFWDVCVDTSRGDEDRRTQGRDGTMTVKANSDIDITGTTSDGKTAKWTVPARGKPPLIGRVVALPSSDIVKIGDEEWRIKGRSANGKTYSLERKVDGRMKTKMVPITSVNTDEWDIKGTTEDGKHYILERVGGYQPIDKQVPVESLSYRDTYSPLVDEAQDKNLLDKVQKLRQALKENGATVLESQEEASRFVGDRVVIPLLGPSDWAALDEKAMEAMRAKLQKLAASLDPSKVVILTGGNRAANPNAFESMVHDIFAGKDAKKPFDILGFMKHDTPADEVDPAVKHVLLIGDKGNWDGPIQALLKFAGERKSAALITAGGGVIKRAIQASYKALSGRLYLMQGHGGASEAEADKGLKVSDLNEFTDELPKVYPEVVQSPKIKPKKIGIYTGGFDPPHLSHKEIVERMKAEYHLDEVIVVPDSGPDYEKKALARGDKPTSLEDRLNMTKLMFKDDPSVHVESIPGDLAEVTRSIMHANPGGETSVIIGTDTAKWLMGKPKGTMPAGISLLINPRGKELTPGTTFDIHGIPAHVAEYKEVQDRSSTAVRQDPTHSTDLTPEVRDYIVEHQPYSPAIAHGAQGEVDLASKVIGNVDAARSGFFTSPEFTQLASSLVKGSGHTTEEELRTSLNHVFLQKYGVNVSQIQDATLRAHAQQTLDSAEKEIVARAQVILNNAGASLGSDGSLDEKKFADQVKAELKAHPFAYDGSTNDARKAVAGAVYKLNSELTQSGKPLPVQSRGTITAMIEASGVKPHIGLKPPTFALPITDEMLNYEKGSDGMGHPLKYLEDKFPAIRKALGAADYTGKPYTDEELIEKYRGGYLAIQGTAEKPDVYPFPAGTYEKNYSHAPMTRNQVSMDNPDLIKGLQGSDLWKEISASGSPIVGVQKTAPTELYKLSDFNYKLGQEIEGASATAPQKWQHGKEAYFGIGTDGKPYLINSDEDGIPLGYVFNDGHPLQLEVAARRAQGAVDAASKVIANVDQARTSFFSSPEFVKLADTWVNKKSGTNASLKRSISNSLKSLFSEKYGVDISQIKDPALREKAQQTLESAQREIVARAQALIQGASASLGSDGKLDNKKFADQVKAELKAHPFAYDTATIDARKAVVGAVYNLNSGLIQSGKGLPVQSRGTITAMIEASGVKPFVYPVKPPTYALPITDEMLNYEKGPDGLGHPLKYLEDKFPAIRKALGAADYTGKPYSDEEFLEKYRGGYLAIQGSAAKPDVYPFPASTYEKNYSQVPMTREEVTLKNPGLASGFEGSELWNEITAHGSPVVGVKKTAPTELYKLSDFNYQLGQEIEGASATAPQKWQHGKEAYFGIGTDGKPYLVNSDASGDPLGYVETKVASKSKNKKDKDRDEDAKVDKKNPKAKNAASLFIPNSVGQGLGLTAVKTTQGKLKAQAEAQKPTEYKFSKSSYVYKVEAPLSKSLPEWIKEHLGKDQLDNLKAELSANHGKAYIALTFDGKGKADFYAMGDAYFKKAYAKDPISLEAFSKSNPQYSERLGALSGKDLSNSGVMAVMKKDPTPMIKMSDLGYAVDKRVEISTSWGGPPQVKEAGSDAFLRWDNDTGEYHMIAMGADGSPENYSPALPEGLKAKRTIASEHPKPEGHKHTVKDLMSQAEADCHLK